MAMLRRCLLCLLYALWLVDAFMPRKLLANSPFLGLATEDTEKAHFKQKDFESWKIQSLEKKPVIPSLSQERLSPKELPASMQHNSFVDFYTTNPEENLWGGEGKESKRRTSQSESAHSPNQTEKKKQLLKALHSTPFIDILWNVFHSGELPRRVTEALRDDLIVAAPSENQWSKLKDLVPNATFLEIGSGMTAFSVAALNSSSTVVAVITTDDGTNNYLKMLENVQVQHGLPNYYMCYMSLKQLSSTARKLSSDYQVMFETLLLSDLPSLVGMLLPHEFEELLGKFMSLAYHTFIISPNNMFKKGYFTHWVSISDLLTKAKDSVSLTVEFKEISGTDPKQNWAPVTQTGVQLVHATLKNTERPIDPTWCLKKTRNVGNALNKICGLFVTNESSVLLFSDNSKKMAPLRKTAIPLQTLLDLGPISITLQQVLVSLLNMRYSKSHSSRNILISGSTLITLNHNSSEWAPETGEVELSAFVNKITSLPNQVQPIRSTSVNRPYKEFADKTPPLFHDLPPKAKQLVQKMAKPYKTVAKPVIKAVPSKKDYAKPVEDILRKAKDVKDRRVELPVARDPIVVDKMTTFTVTSQPVTPKPAKQAVDVWEHEVEDQTKPTQKQHFEDQWSRETDDMIIPQQKTEQLKKIDLSKEAKTRLEGVERELDREIAFEEPHRTVEKIHTTETVAKQLIEQDNNQGAHIDDMVVPLGKQDSNKIANVRDKDVGESKPETKAVSLGRVKNLPGPKEVVSKVISHDEDEAVQVKSERKMPDKGNAVKAGEKTNMGIRKKTTLSKMLRIPERSQEKAPLRQNGFETTREEGKNDAKLQSDVNGKGIGDLKSKLEKTNNGDEGLHLRRRLLAVDETPVEEKKSKTVVPSKKKDPGGKMKYASWLQHHGDHLSVYKPSSETTNSVSNVKQLLSKLEDSLGSEADGNKQERTKAQNRDNSKEESDQPLKPATISPLQRLLSMRARQRVLRDAGTSTFDIEWSVIQRNIEDEQMKNFSAFVYGGQQQVLMGTKLARMAPNASVVIVIPPTHMHVFKAHRAMLKSLSLSNVVTFRRDLSPETIKALHSQPDLFRFQFLGTHIFQSLIPLGSDFVYHLGRVLTLARTTILEIPSPAQLMTGSAILLGQDGATLGIFQGIVTAALKSAGVTESSVSVIEQNKGMGGFVNELELLNVTIIQMTRQVNIDCAGGEGKLILSTPFKVTLKTNQAENRFVRALSAVSLSFLIKLDLENEDRMNLFKDYLDLPLREDMCPLHIVWYKGHLHYSATVGDRVHEHGPSQINDEAMVELLKELLKKEKKNFSFIDYESQKGQISLPLAAAFPNSTFVSLESDKILAYKHFNILKAKKLFNNVIGLISTNMALTRKLLESPDFVRFQFVGMRKFLEMITDMPKKEFGIMLGQLFATGKTTFLQMPSSQALSLAFSTFFPSLMPTLVGQQSFLREDHPLKVFKQTELRLVAESARAEVTNNVSARILKPSYGPPDMVHSWQVLEVDILNLTTMVNHHFDYELDGHKRKYMQHCLSSKAGWEVYLTRMNDGFKIPYNSLHGMSLIALLRLGLLPEIKDMFYDMFVRLPLYEDMAPWNILFQGGKLTYIDYDTKDYMFNKMVPTAYQVMSMLMNYQRTISDFGHCKESASNPYNFPYISSCVDSPFNGPCKDSKNPVPCGDYTCRSTYVECLRALNELEFKRNELFKQLQLLPNMGPTAHTSDSNIAMLENGMWVYDQDGIMIKRAKVEKLPEYKQTEVSWRL